MKYMITAAKRLFAITLAVMMFTGAFCLTSYADAAADDFGRKVFEGKDGWLFYSGDDTIADYKGTDLFTAAQLDALCRRLETFRDILSSQGCEFVMLIAPNKEQLYSQYMPDSYGALTLYTRAQQITDSLRSHGIKVVYPIAELKAASLIHPEYDIYYRRDTHWNELGAYIGARALMSELGIEMPPIEDLIIEPKIHDSEALGRQIGRSLKDTGYDITGYIYESMDSLDVVSDVVWHTSKTGADERKVLMAGDSFLVSLYPYVSQEFDDVTVSFERSAEIPALMEAIHPDVYVYEVVERYVNDMIFGNGLEAPYSWTMKAMQMAE